MYPCLHASFTMQWKFGNIFMIIIIIIWVFIPKSHKIIFDLVNHYLYTMKVANGGNIPPNQNHNDGVHAYTVHTHITSNGLRSGVQKAGTRLCVGGREESERQQQAPDRGYPADNVDITHRKLYATKSQ